MNLKRNLYHAPGMVLTSSCGDHPQKLFKTPNFCKDRKESVADFENFSKNCSQIITSVFLDFHLYVIQI